MPSHLLIKTSSLGDVIHTLPALTDLQHCYPDMSLDWVVEENFAEIPTWHSMTHKVIPVSLRRWRKSPIKSWRTQEWQQFKQQLTAQHYDSILDAQGLLKSACLAWQAQGKRSGFDSHSAREPLASYFYHQHYHIEKNQHAVERLRQLFAQHFNYDYSTLALNYGLDNYFTKEKQQAAYLVFLHGTTWVTKHWPDENWYALTLLASKAGYQIKCAWGNEQEYQRAKNIAAVAPHSVEILPKGNLTTLAKTLTNASAVVGVDTGLAHLAAALSIPTLSLYAPTRPSLTGTYGAHQHILQAEYQCAPCLRKQCRYSAASPPCYQSLSAEKIWQTLQHILLDTKEIS